MPSLYFMAFGSIGGYIQLCTLIHLHKKPKKHSFIKSRTHTQWEEFMSHGGEEEEGDGSEMQRRWSCMAPNKCSTLIYTVRVCLLP